MKYSTEVQKALKSCATESTALQSATIELDRMTGEKRKIEAAISAIHANTETTRKEKRTIGGVEVEVVTGTKADDMAALAATRDGLTTQIGRAAQSVETARRVLSRAVAEKLQPQQVDLKARTLALLDLATGLALDGDALEAAIAGAGLDPSTVYCCRFHPIQDLRIDQRNTTGADISSRIKNQ